MMPRRNSRTSLGNRKNQTELASGLKDLRHTIDKANAANSQCIPSLESINTIHSKINSVEGQRSISTSQVCKLKQLTSQAIEETDVEIEALKNALCEINRLKELRGDKRHYLTPGARSTDFFNEDSSSLTGLDTWSILGPRRTMRRGALMTLLKETALALPLYSGDDPPPPLCGAVPPENNYIVPTGHYVAAKVKTCEEDIVLTPVAPSKASSNGSGSSSANTSQTSSSSSKNGGGTKGAANGAGVESTEESPGVNENWILAECVGFNNLGTNKYEIVDIDEENRDSAKHVLGKRRVVPLPIMKADPLLYPKSVYHKGARVMALYPQTTCFYSAVVHESPQHATDEYRVLFEDSSYRDGYSPPLCVPIKFVVAVKEPPGSKRKP